MVLKSNLFCNKSLVLWVDVAQRNCCVIYELQGVVPGARLLLLCGVHPKLAGKQNTEYNVRESIEIDAVINQPGKCRCYYEMLDFGIT